MYKLNCKYICGSVNTSLIDYDKFNETSSCYICDFVQKPN